MNTEYKGTQQDLTDEKERLQGYAGLRGIKVSLQQESRLTFAEKLTNKLFLTLNVLTQVKSL